MTQIKSIPVMDITRPAQEKTKTGFLHFFQVIFQICSKKKEGKKKEIMRDRTLVETKKAHEKMKVGHGRNGGATRIEGRKGMELKRTESWEHGEKRGKKRKKQKS